jgi:hypothetical protein
MVRIPHDVCRFSGRALDFAFDYDFLFRLDGTGTASVEWTYGRDSFCATCTVLDNAVLSRIGDAVVSE